jgi:Protein of unknown function (DUF2505)
VRFTAQLSYDTPPDAVFAMLADQRFQDLKLEGTGALDHSSKITQADGTTLITTSRTLPTDRVPDAFRTLLGGKLVVEQTESWTAPAADLSRTGTVAATIPGAPLKMTGTLALRPDGHGGTIETVMADLKASVPLIGGRIEKAAEPALRSAIEVEQRIGREWLASH